jgi:Bacteriocin-protection, YdeI or OmpD-Associated/Domain of unknown function (DUF1905)
MTKDRDFKKVVRVRIAKTGESYAAARAQLTKPAGGETFEKGTGPDGAPRFRMYTRLQTPEKGWSGLAVPSQFLGLRRRVGLRGSMNGKPFWVSAQPMGDGNHWVTVNKAMRAEMGLVGDEEVRVEFVIDDKRPPVAVPPDLAAALKVNGAAAANFERMAPSHRKEYVLHILEAKRLETRARRIEQVVKRLSES